MWRAECRNCDLASFALDVKRRAGQTVAWGAELGRDVQAMQDGWVDDVLAFWFRELEPKQWFFSTKELDDLIRARFGHLVTEISIDSPAAASTDPKVALAAVIVLDQFPRNIYRGTARAFATDDLALRIATQAVDNRLDQQLEPPERLFLYLPFEHSEVSADQDRSVMLFEALGMEEPLRYAIEHRDIIRRFGRFPHRNAILGRQSTEEELAFMKEHAGYGQ